MLDPEAPDERRDQIATAVRERINAAGTLKNDDVWGLRKLAYEIRQRTEADYRFFRFESEPAVLPELDHSLKIADGVLRFRLFKVDPRVSANEPPPPVALSSSRERGDRGDRRGPREGRGGQGGRRDGAPREAPGPPPAAATPGEPDQPASEAPAGAGGE